MPSSLNPSNEVCTSDVGEHGYLGLQQGAINSLPWGIRPVPFPSKEGRQNTGECLQSCTEIGDGDANLARRTTVIASDAH